MPLCFYLTALQGVQEIAIIGTDDFTQAVVKVLSPAEKAAASPTSVGIVQEGFSSPSNGFFVSSALEQESIRRALNVLRQWMAQQALLGSFRSKNLALVAFNEELEAKLSRRTKELAQANATLARMASIDGLTGLLTHRVFIQRLTQEVERSHRNGSSFTVLLLDIKNFHAYNESNGYQAGDTLLKRIAEMLMETQRTNDCCCRYGGDEMAVALMDTDSKTARMVAKRIEERISELDNDVAVTVASVNYPLDAKNCADLLSVAESRLTSQ